MNQERVKEVVLSALGDVNAELPDDDQLEISLDTVLIGEGAELDSLGLVHCIMIVEQALSEHWELPMSLANEQTMDESSSPIHTVGALIDYVVQALSQAGDQAA